MKITEWDKEYEIKSGTTFKETTYFVAEIIDGVETPIDLTGFQFKMLVVDDCGKTVKEINEEGFDLTDVANGYFKRKDFVFDFKAGDYFSDIRFTDGDLVLNTGTEKITAKQPITT